MTNRPEELYAIASAAIGRHAANRLEGDYSNCAEHLGSPIEHLMFWLIAAQITDCHGSPVRFRPPGYQKYRPGFGHLTVLPQCPVLTYRVDFLLVQGGGLAPPTYAVIECDGHDYHERTPEQATRDRGRDRDLQATGIGIFRYPGRDIWAAKPTLLEPVATYLYGRLPDERDDADVVIVARTQP